MEGTWIKYLDPEVLPEPYRKLSKMIGLENTLLLAQEFQGTNLYLPKLDSTLKAARDKRIREEFDGQNIKALALKYGLTESWVRQILGGYVADSNQGTLFDGLDIM